MKQPINITTISKGQHQCEVNGAAAHLISAGDEIAIMGIEISDEAVEPLMILVDELNRFVKYL